MPEKMSREKVSLICEELMQHSLYLTCLLAFLQNFACFFYYIVFLFYYFHYILLLCHMLCRVYYVLDLSLKQQINPSHELYIKF